MTPRSSFHQFVDEMDGDLADLARPAFHVAIDELEDDLMDALATVRPGSGTVQVLSTVRAGAPVGAEMDARYWFENFAHLHHAPVEFDGDLNGNVLNGCDTFQGSHLFIA